MRPLPFWLRLFPTPSLQQQRQKEMVSLENLETSAPFCVFPFLFGLIRQKFYLITE